MLLALITLPTAVSTHNVTIMEGSDAALEALGSLADEHIARDTPAVVVSVTDLADIILMQRMDAAREGVQSDAAYDELTRNMIATARRYIRA
jgi:hypothetical protein